LVTDYKCGKWAHNIRAAFGSGRADIATDPLVQGRANPNITTTYSLTYDLPQGSQLGSSIYLSVFNIFNSRQALQYEWSTGNRLVDSRVPSRFISMGLKKAF
jgi:hypothetical protein